MINFVFLEKVIVKKRKEKRVMDMGAMLRMGREKILANREKKAGWY